MLFFLLCERCRPCGRALSCLGRKGPPNMTMNDRAVRRPGTFNAGEPENVASDLPAVLKFQHADLRRLHDYWLARRHGDGLPMREDIDPLDLGWMLDRISLFECHAGAAADGGVRFRCRVAGTWYARRFDFEANGSWLDTWPDQHMRQSVQAFYRLIHGDGRPRRVVRQYDAGDVPIIYEGAGLPLGARTGTGVAMILVGAALIDAVDLTGLELIYAGGPYRNWAG